MKEEEKQRKFHEALLRMLYPPPPSPPHQEEDGEEQLTNLIDPLYHLPGELEDEKRNTSSSSGDDNEVENCVPEKPTRAQRKRLRKKKLKEAACQRRKIIGPLLPGSRDDGNDGNVDVQNTLESVRQNVTSECNIVTGSSGEFLSVLFFSSPFFLGQRNLELLWRSKHGCSGEPASCSQHNKIKQRRKSKKTSGNLTSSKH